MKGIDLGNIDDIDSLTKMLKLVFSSEDWHNMIIIADRLYEESSVQYYYQLQQPTKISPHTRPLIYYIGFSQLCKGVAYQKMKQYQESRECIQKYIELSRIKGVEEKDQYIVEDFHIFALGNTYTVDLLEGKHEVLVDYIQYLKQNPRELIAGMINIFEYAIKNDLAIKWVLTDLSDELEKIESNPQNPTTARYFTEYLCLYSLYLYKQGDYHNAVERNLEALTASIMLEDNTAFKKLLALFESFREYADKEQEERYKTHFFQFYSKWF
ncbi:hypothetical protein [Paenibacillus sp. HW567]|uniref:hypothetical protein n=1 Tax=Paenibacillus sp. HW567 TaxID=1034769 RepID=UPI0003765108|nr:hypothetical protein [Paenibacillus sp. HW567]